MPFTTSGGSSCRPSPPSLPPTSVAAECRTAQLDHCVAAWLHAKEGRTGSERTRRAYADALAAFRTVLQRAGQELDSDPALIALAAQGWAAHNSPKPSTFNQRLAILSSFYAYARKAEVLTGENPIERTDRRSVQRYASSRALDRTDVAARMASIDRSTLEGQRDYCLLAVGLQTGRRVAELASLRWGDVSIGGSQITFVFRRCKGGKRMEDKLPAALSKVLATYLRAVYGERLHGLDKDAAIWVSFSPQNAGAAIGTQAVRDVCERHLGTTKVHALRHTFAHTLEETGAKLSEIQARLGHTNAATTGVYLSELRKAENPHADALAALLGLDVAA